MIGNWFPPPIEGKRDESGEIGGKDGDRVWQGFVLVIGSFIVMPLMGLRSKLRRPMNPFRALIETRN